MIAQVARVLHPLLLRLEPERAHGLSVLGLRAWPDRPAPACDPRLAVDAFGLHFPNPLGLAAGYDKGGDAPDNLLALGFGFVEIGTVTPLPQPGNPRPRLFRLPASGGIINRLGFNSEGHAVVHRRLAARKGRGIVGVNVGANKDSADRTADYASGIAAFADVSSYVTINISSPNTPGLRNLQQAAALDDLLARAGAARDASAPTSGRKPLLLKVAPDLTEAELDDIVRVARARKVDGMIFGNTTVTRPADVAGDRDAEQAGGLSGRPLFALSTRVLAQAFLRVEGQFPLVGAGGIDSAETALAKIDAGASLLQVYSSLVFSGPQRVPAILDGLVAAMAADGTALRDRVGRHAAAYAAGQG